ncbi:MAG: recombinase family protein [Clostridium sp.]|nr:recombinase family protein [Clostridium sp.]
MCKVNWRAFAYYRLSKEDDFYLRHGISAKKIKDESNSITNQRRLVHRFLNSKEEIVLVNEFADDGFTGLDYERPGFQNMLSRIPEERINCIIVKDFSRLGRDYLENCRYIERIFPEMGIRFISINDNYDSSAERTQSDNIIIPFKNLINENYSRDASVKIRSHMAVKWEAGDFIAPFAVYGYRKDEENPNLLIPDPYASKVVSHIFYMKVRGMSQKSIAKYLNREGVLTPLAYKESTGSRYKTAFKRKNSLQWSENMVLRILSNRIYTGVLEQGKIRKVNYKTHARKCVPMSEWIRHPHSHQPVVDKFIFDIVQHLLEIDTRLAPGNEELHLFSGLLYCGDCNMPLVRKREKHGSKEYIYYLCSGWKKSGQCSSHRINERKLYERVLKTLQIYMQVLTDRKKALPEPDCEPAGNYRKEIIRQESEMLHSQVNKVNRAKLSLYEDYKEGILDREEYEEFREMYHEEEEGIKEKLDCLEEKRKHCEAGGRKNSEWMDRFKQCKGINSLDRGILVLLVHHIEIQKDHSLKIRFYHRDEFEKTMKELHWEVKTIGEKE